MFTTLAVIFALVNAIVFTIKKRKLMILLQICDVLILLVSVILLVVSTSGGAPFFGYPLIFTIISACGFYISVSILENS